jgi:drug/metabolite transporter (DMT)-like permease
MEAMRKQHLLLGASCIIGAELMFASMGVSIRFVAAELPNAIIVFFRNIIGLAIMAPWLLQRGSCSLRTTVPLLHLLRGLAGLSAMYCFFYALAHMPLAEAMLLKLSSPLFIPLVALVWLGEAVPGRVWWAIAIGFAGVTFILRPGIDDLSPVALIALLGGLFAAIAKVTVRRLARTEPALRTVFYFALTGTLVATLPAVCFWQAPSTEAMAWLVAIAGFATLGQLLLTHGFSLAPAARMASFGYFSVVFGALYGWLFWRETLSWGTITGSLLVFVAGYLASRGKSRLESSPVSARETVH